MKSSLGEVEPSCSSSCIREVEKGWVYSVLGIGFLAVFCGRHNILIRTGKINTTPWPVDQPKSVLEQNVGSGS